MTMLQREQAKNNLRFYRLKLKYQETLNEDTTETRAMIKALEKKLGQGERVG